MNNFKEIYKALLDGKTVELVDISTPPTVVMSFHMDDDGKIVSSNPSFTIERFNPKDFRIKRNTININGIEVPAPITDRNEIKFYYWSVGLDKVRQQHWSSSYCDGDDTDKFFLENGLIHLYEKDAEEHRMALLTLQGFRRNSVSKVENDWWCPTCKRIVDGKEVTFYEHHESCGTFIG